jgi:hypothetical protein
MSIFFVVIIILLIAGLLFSYHYKREKQKKDFYPSQKLLLLELINDLKTSKVDVILSKEGPEDSSATLTLFEAKNFIDNGRELSHEKYDDYKLFFTDDSSQVIDFKKYIYSRYLPDEVLDDLKRFYNSEFIKADPTGLYFIVITETGQETTAKENNEGLLSGDGEAFESWLTFKESAYNLNFVIGQWIRDNCELNDTKLFEQLDYIDG